MQKILLTLIILLHAVITSSQPYFTDVAISSGINHKAVRVQGFEPMSGGAAWFDYDNNGYDDLYLTGGFARDAFYRNNGNGTFTLQTNSAGFGGMDETVFTTGVSAGDIDNDGFKDVFITTLKSHHNYLFHNNGNGAFTDITLSAGVADTANSTSTVFGDYNADGFLDIYVANWCEEYNVDLPTVKNFFYINNGDLTFTESSVAYGIADSTACSLAAAFTDYDNDHDMDLLVANDFGYYPNHTPNSLFQNQFPLDTFFDVSTAANANFAMNGMGVAIADYDENGMFDYLVTDMETPLLMHNSAGVFTNEAVAAGLQNDQVPNLDNSGTRPTVSWGCAFFDFDHDTYSDIFIAQGDLSYDFPRPALDPNKLYRNNGDGTFSDVSVSGGIDDTYISRALAYSDYDNDGDVDVLVGILDSANGSAHSFLFRNDAATGNWLKVKTHGMTANRDGYGARVEVVFNGRTLIREVDGGSSYNSHNSSVVHIGLGNATYVDSLIITWPGGNSDAFYHVPANILYEAVEGTGGITVDASAFVRADKFAVFPNPAQAGNTVFFKTVFSSSPSASLVIYDLKGNRVAEVFSSKKLTEGNTLIEWSLPSALTPGVYNCRLETENGVLNQRLIVF
ncbi:MAG: FG-GAP-like repeat-containing protein [Bacteroidia bacterium]